jgi:hypothetical protein
LASLAQSSSSPQFEPMGEVMDLNMSWITPFLAVGGRFSMAAAEHLAERLGIRCIVDLREECCDDETVLRRHGIELLHLPTQDTCAVSMTMLTRGVEWVSEKLSTNQKVYVHCEHGIGRSALLTGCVLVSQGDSPTEALERMKTARIQVSPSPEQLNAFIAWSQSWRKRQGLSWALPTFEELANIAYRHLRGDVSSEG